MIKLSDLKQASTGEDTLTSTYLRGNELELVIGKDFIITGPSKVIFQSTAGFLIQDGTQGTIGDVWTQTAPDGSGSWITNPNNLQAGYQADNTIITSSTYGDLVISGTEAMVIDAYGGLILLEPLVASADAYFTEAVELSGELIIQDGSEGVDGYVWTSTDTEGRGSWIPLPQASPTSEGLISRESDSGEAPLGPLVWSGAPPTTIVTSPSHRCIRVGNRVDVWFIAAFSTPGGSPSSSVIFDLPPSCPPPTLWTGQLDDQTITQGTGSLFDSVLATQEIDRTNEVNLYKSGPGFKIKITTFDRVQNSYGSHVIVPISPVGFNAHITYFTDV